MKWLKRLFANQGLLNAARTGDAEKVHKLLELGVDKDIKDEKFGWTPLQFAAWNGHTAIVDELIRKGANIEVKLSSGDTPLLQAVMGGRASVVQVLI